MRPHLENASTHAEPSGVASIRSGTPDLDRDYRLNVLAAVVARQVTELLREQPDQVDTWIDAAEVARRHSISRGWVYAHAHHLGAVRLGAGDRPRLRFDPVIVRQRLEALAPVPLPRTAPAPVRRPNRRRRSSGENLLPIKGSQRAGGAA